MGNEGLNDHQDEINDAQWWIMMTQPVKSIKKSEFTAAASWRGSHTPAPRSGTETLPAIIPVSHLHISAPQSAIELSEKQWNSEHDALNVLFCNVRLAGHAATLWIVGNYFRENLHSWKVSIKAWRWAWNGWKPWMAENLFRLSRKPPHESESELDVRTELHSGVNPWMANHSAPGANVLINQAQLRIDVYTDAVLRIPVI